MALRGLQLENICLIILFDIWQINVSFGGLVCLLGVPLSKKFHIFMHQQINVFRLATGLYSHFEFCLSYVL